MSDVFVSYARPDEAYAKRVAEGLQDRGYQVWRDDELPAHRGYAEVIEERLQNAKAVVVLWSAEAAGSQWVRAEADAARSAGTLVQATLDGSIPPLPFNQIQCADLTGWRGAEDSAGWQKLAASVDVLAERTESSAEERAQTRREPAICVLPFANMSGDAEQEYFSDGISEDITTDLSKISALSVIARNTAFTFKGQAVNVRDIARKLGVSHVLEGSVRKAGSCVRITAQLIDGATGDHIWAERYDRDLTDIFEIQDEISGAIVSQLKIKLLPNEKKAIEQRGTANADAYNLFLKARQSWIDGDFGESGRERRVIKLCKSAVSLDTNYAQAWALMALAQANLRYAYTGNEDMDDGLAAADRALSLDPEIAEAYLPRAWHLAMHGNNDEATAEIETALRLNPESWEANKEAARVYYRQGRIEEATRHLEKATMLAEEDFHSRGMLSAVYLARGEIERATDCARKVIGLVEAALNRNPDNGAALAYGALSFAAVGELQTARQWIGWAEERDPANLFMRYNLAFGLATIGASDEAIKMLRPVLAKGGPSTIRLAAADPNLDSLRTDPRFERMIEAALARVDAPRS
jgi:adenylate cyclase